MRKLSELTDHLIYHLSEHISEKKAFYNYRLLKDWPQIVGLEISSYTTPGPLYFNENNIGEKSCTLILKLFEPAKALKLEYSLLPLIKDNIANYFGFSLVTEIKIIQTPKYPKGVANEALPSQLIKRNVNESLNLAKLLEDIEDPHLKSLLYEIGSNISP